MTKKKWLIGLSAVAILGGGTAYFAPTIQETAVVNSETIKAEKFDDMKEVPVEIMDTSAFGDKHLEKWFKENVEKGGEYVYFDNKHTYTLVTAGKESVKNQIIWLDGVRASKDTLIVGYEFKDGKDFGVKKEDNSATSLLIRTEGEFKSVKGIIVEKEEPKPIPSEVTEEVNEGEKADEKAKDKAKDKADEKSDEKADKEVKEKADKKEAGTEKEEAADQKS